MGSGAQSPAVVIAEWLADWDGPVLLALDAPLGWPARLAEALVHHQAGDYIDVAPNQLFRRLTDEVVKQRIGKQSLDVGADRIARTAHAALALMEELRRRLGRAVSTGWTPGQVDGVQAIEVYPAATLAAHGIASRGYKADEAARRSIASALQERMRLTIDIPAIDERADGLDACICLLAAQDYLNGAVIPAAADPQVRKEGWIWVRG